jgi:hypothetical protein
MNIKNNVLFLFLGLFIFGFSSNRVSAQYDYGTVTYNDFYQDLAPYGQWIEDPQYGYVWSPDVDGSFRPYYTNGHWAMTDYGNTWVSDYPWGWACFHYGRWTYDGYYGWLWVPGPYWGPAWVSWRYGEGCYGWAPLAPGFDFNADYSCPNDWWVFIPVQYIYSGQYYRYWYGPRNNSHLVHNTDLVNNTFENNHVKYVQGPRVKEVEGAIHQPVQVFKISNSRSRNAHVHNDVIKMYRPNEVRPAPPIDGRRPTPPNVVSAPQPVAKPQSISGKPNKTPDFKVDVPRTKDAADAPGTHFTEPPKEEPRKNNTTNPYEWDVNRSVPQPQRQDNPEPQQQIRQQSPRQNPPAQQARPVPQQSQPQPPPHVQPQQARPQPVPAPQPQQRPQPVQRTESRPTPVPPPSPRQEGRR